ncbi:MAG TPA: Nramp family divalent metal transporter [Candidatus Acidoferrum sp.]|jgi:NRAMP (natural resistance-associated macrophage protein)-like metal ion transporter
MSEISLSKAGLSPPSAEERGKLFASLGPGLITGAADDDPSGIATYSQVGAQFGFAMLWTMLFSFPLMASIQEICARLGRITGMGVAANLAKCYPKSVVRGLVLLLCAANVFNLGADVAAMAAVIQMLVGGRPFFYAIFFGVASLLLQVYVPYRRYVRYLKWLTWALFAYVVAAFVVHVPWTQVLRSTLIPSVSLDSEYLMALIAVLGTTISPYLFFWQTSQEVEEVRINKHESPLRKKPAQAWAQFRRIAFDTRVGMAFSNIVAFFIILTTAATLHAANAGIHIQTAADAAKALQPLAGRFASLLFALGIIGTGMLAIPVLAGSAAYAVSELFGWRASLESKPRSARKFYYVLSAATALGVCLNFVGIDPIRALFLSAVINGIVAVPLMFLLMLISQRPAIVGKFVVPTYLRVVGWIATGVMLVASLGFLVTTLHQSLAR